MDISEPHKNRRCTGFEIPKFKKRNIWSGTKFIIYIFLPAVGILIEKMKVSCNTEAFHGAVPCARNIYVMIYKK